MIGELESPIKVIVQQAEQEDKKTEQKATGGLDKEPQSKRSEIIERKENGRQKISKERYKKIFHT